MSRWLAQAELLFDVAVRLVALALLVSLFVAACHDVSKAYDGWFYHLPFAARLTGIVDGDTYVFGSANRVRYQGFPLATELLQGLVWRITGRIECANLVAFASLPAMALFAKRVFGTPAHLTVLALLAVPLVQIHATAVYVDLPANTAAAMLCLLAWRALGDPKPPSPKTLAFASALAAFTANTKFQLVPTVVIVAMVLVVRSVKPEGARAKRLAVIAASLPFVFFTPLKNLVMWGNPVWPIELTILGHHFPHVEGAYASSPIWLEHVPQQARFAASVIEAGLRPIASHARWSLDQWTPPSHDAYRMGGFFGAYVAVLLVALFVFAKRGTKLAFVAFTLAVASMPQSHELRYYMVWMIVLVMLVLVSAARTRPRAAALVASAAFAVVVWSTEGGYLYASGDSFRTLVADKVDRSVIEGIRDGERICVSRQPWTFLYAPRFHPEKRYVVQEAEGAEDCNGARWVDAR